MKLLLVAACALIDADGRVLIAKRPAGKDMAGLWEFPGGKVDPGERPEMTLIRELKEELGIDFPAGRSARRTRPSVSTRAQAATRTSLMLISAASALGSKVDKRGLRWTQETHQRTACPSALPCWLTAPCRQLMQC